MKIFIGLILCLIIVVVVTKLISPLDNAISSTVPRYTWVTFKSFWNKHTAKEVKIKDAQKVAGGYVVEYRNGVRLHVNEENKRITSVCANFYNRNNDAGGQTFIKIKNRIINFGTFRWPFENILEVRSLFENIGKYDINYSYRTSSFSLSYVESEGWALCLRFIESPTIEE